MKIHNFKFTVQKFTAICMLVLLPAAAFAITDTTTPTVTETATMTVTETASMTVTETATKTVTATTSATTTPTVTQTMTQTVTKTSTEETQTFTATGTATYTATSTSTSSPTRTATSTGTATSTHSYTYTDTATQTYTGTETPTETGTPSLTLTASYTPTPFYTPTIAANVISIMKHTCYPNPVKRGGEFYMIYEEAQASEITVLIYTLDGAEAKKYEFKNISGSGKLPVGIKNLAPGLYFYRVKVKAGNEEKVDGLKRFLISK